MGKKVVRDMRENKFKVWCKNKKEWEKDICLLTQEGLLLHMDKTKYLCPCSPKTHIVVFYTGLKDRKGVEIWEGDILEREVNFDMTKKEHDGVRCPPRIRHLCEWIEESVSFVFNVINAKYPFNASIFIGHIWEYEIIGNKFENPELRGEK